MTTYINPLNATAENFDNEAFDAIVNDLRRAQKAILVIDETHLELQERFDQAKVNLQKSIDDMNFDYMQKFTAEAKRVEKKLGEAPELKYQAFDDAVKRLAKFTTPVESAQVVDFDHAVGE